MSLKSVNNNVNNFRKWLSKNEIFFTTLSSLLISIMAVILSYNSNQLTKNQLELQLIDKQPEFKVFGFIKTKELDYIANDFEINIYHISGRYTNENIELKTFLNFSLTDTTYFKKSIIIQLYDYLDWVYPVSNQNGLISRTSYFNNFHNLNVFRKKISEEILKDGRFKANQIDVITICEISYLDILGQSQSLYYQIDPVKVEQVFASNNKLVNTHFLGNPKDTQIKTFYLSSMESENIEKYSKIIIEEFRKQKP